MTKRRIAIFAAVWMSLFGVTIGVRLLSRGGTKSAQAQVPPTDDAARADLAAKARKSFNGLDMSSSKVATQYRQFAEALPNALLERKAGFRDCRLKVMSRSKRRTEFFEISFLVRASSIDLNELRFDDVVIERSSIQLSTEDERCIREQVSHVRIANVAAPTSRVIYPMCFNAEN